MKRCTEVRQVEPGANQLVMMKSTASAIYSSRRAGFALVLVLGFLVLLTALVIAFFSSVSTDYASTKQYSNAANAKLLSDSVVQIVMGQIRLATSGTNLAWASQPGMIRTFDDSGNSVTNFKLYSSDAMTTTGALTGDAPANWSGSPSALWTDLNAPVTDVTGTANFPILDGNNMKQFTTDAAGVSVPAYFSYDADADGVPDITGFSIDANSVNYSPSLAVSGSNTPVPFPVKWLYQLRDGSLIAPDIASTTTATFANSAIKPSASNPIVGRVAFWTDDETSKVNINTAGEGTYWDTPRFYGQDSDPTQLGSSSVLMKPTNTEMQYAYNQPAIGEFQRYPGHPAQVALSPIFRKLGAITDPATLADTLAGITPRFASGGSKAGTARATGSIDLATARRPSLYASVDELMFGSNMDTSGTCRQITQDALKGQFVTKADLAQARFFITANSRAPEVNLFGKPRVSTWPIHTSLAINPNSPYATAYDRLTAFCTTLSGTNRYHFQREKSNDTTFDYVGIPRNKDLYSYLQDLTSRNIPGFGGNFSSKYGTDRDQILTEIFDYIRCTDDFDANLGPAPGGTMPPAANKQTLYQFAPYLNYNWYASYGQITPIQIPTATGTNMGFGRFPTVSEVGVMFICCADSTLPASTGTCSRPEAARLASTITTPGQLPSYTGSNAAWINGVTNFMTVGATNYFTSWSNPAQNPTYKGVALTGTNQKLYQMALLLKTFCPAQGLFPIQPDYIGQISGINGTPLDQAITITGATPSNPFPAAPYSTYYCNKVGAGQWATGGNSGVAGTWGPGYQSGNHNDPFYNQTWGRAIYPFISRPFILPSTTNALQFASDVNLTIKVYQGLYSADTQYAKSGGLPSYTNYTVQQVVSNPANLVQTINFTLPAKPFPAPSLATTSGTSDNGCGVLGSSPYLNWQAWYLPTRNNFYLSYGAESSPYPWTDVVQSVSICHGDPRLVAASSNVPASVFQPFKLPTGAQYGDGTTALAEYFRNWEFNMSSADPIQTGDATAQGKLVPATYINSYKPRSPDVPTVPLGGNPSGKRLSDPTLSTPFYGPAYTMDWDTSMVGEIQDGAYINKADDGDFQGFNQGGFNLPYFNYGVSTSGTSLANSSTFLTPNRIMPSPGMFGSLPTGVKRGLPWQTLLFRPAMQANGQVHPNAGVLANGLSYTTPPDHLIMDLFWTPVVQPYAISDPFSTAGKINLNYQIAPFTYIDRSTPLVCLMKSEKLVAVPTADSGYKGYGNQHIYRLPLDTTESGSLRQFKERFSQGEIFRSASEICDIFLKPKTDATGAVVPTWSNDAAAVTFWSNNLLTGDNMREKPYTNLYPRLTTKSNTYTVHFRVQTLQKVPGTSAVTWVEGKDKVTGEYRGSSLIERYIDPADPSLADFADPANSNKTLDAYYKFRVVSTKRFDP